MSSWNAKISLLNISGDPLDSSSSSRSRSAIIPTPNLPESAVSVPPQSRFSTSTRISSSRFSGGVGFNDSGVGSTCTTINFTEKERTGHRCPSSSGGCTLVTGGVEDCSKTCTKPYPLSSTMKPHTRTYYDHHYGKCSSLTVDTLFQIINTFFSIDNNILILYK